MDQTVAIIWSIVAIITAALCIFGWVILSRTSSRKNGFHAFVASLLASHVLLCIAVTPLLVFPIFLHSDWTVLGCHALYWLWTITWVSDIMAVCASLIWGLVKLQHMRSTFRLGATIAISGVWLIATTSAGILAFFNERIKDKTDLQSHGCDLMPKLDETALAIGVFTFLLICIVTSISLLTSFLILLAFSARKSARIKKENSTQIEDNASVNGHVANGHGHISREPSRLEDIEEYRVRRGVKNRSLIVNKTEQRQLYDWRNCLSAIFTSMLFLDILPQVILLGFHIFRHEYIPNGDVILISCHLANSFLLPVIMATTSTEYRYAALSILRGKQTQNTGSQGIYRNHGSTRPNGHSSGHAAPNGQQEQSGQPNPAFSEIDIRIQGPTPSPESSPNVARSESRLSRLEWKEHMLKSAKIPVSVYSESRSETQKETEVERRSERESDSLQGSLETDSDTAVSVNGCFTDSDIDRVLDTTPPPQAKIEENNEFSSNEETKGNGDTSTEKSSEHEKSIEAETTPINCEKSDTASEKSFKRHTKHRKRKEKGNRRAQDIYATISRALGLEDADGTSNNVGYDSDMPRPLSRSAMVYSPNNPFLKTLQEEEEGDLDTESERSVEAEIVAITIRGRGSFKRKLKNRGLLKGVNYVRGGNDVTSYDLNPEVRESKGNSLKYVQQQGCPDTGYGTNFQTVESESRPMSRMSTNPFVNDIEGADNGQYSHPQTSDSYTREWVENRQETTQYVPSNQHSNPFLNYSFEAEPNDTEDIRKRSSSNPFLQDIESSGDQGQSLGGFSDTLDDEFVTRSAPTSPPMARKRSKKNMKPVALAVSIVELLKSKDEGLAQYDTGNRHGFTNGHSKPSSDSTGHQGAYMTEYL